MRMQQQAQTLAYYPLRAVFAKLLCLLTLGLVFVGGVVTSNNAGLAVPDWPTSFGYQMWAMPFAMWHGGILYEHSHRVLASIVGLFVLILAVWLMCVETRRRIRLLVLSSLALVILQGILGGVGVLLSLPVAVSVMHGVLAQLFFCLTIVLAYALSRERVLRLREPAHAVAPEFRRAVLALALLILVQLVLAASMRHELKLQGGVAIPDFPTTAGRWLPWVDQESVTWVNAWRQAAVQEHGAPFDVHAPVQLFQLAMHLAHRFVAGILVLAFVWLTVAARRRRVRDDGVLAAVYGIDALLLVQVVLGAFTVWSNRGPLITSLHVMTGAAILGGAVLLVLRVLPAGWVEGEALAPADEEGTRNHISPALGRCA